MARIPVERTRKRPPLWVWLLAALALVALLGLLFELFLDEDAAGSSFVFIRPTASAISESEAATMGPETAPAGSGDPLATTEAPAAGTGSGENGELSPISDTQTIIAAPDPPALVGRRVELQGVQVQEVTGDVSFWVGPSQGEQLLVILDEVATPREPTEGRYDINAGQTITILGEIRRFPGLAEAKQLWGVSDEAKLADEQIYLHAERIAFGPTNQPVTDVQASFQQFWEQNGGLPIFGYPLGEPLEENGRTVQYFERARLELHPDNPPGYQVVVGRLGAELLELQGTPWQMQPTSPGRAAGCLYFPETKHNLCNQEVGQGFLNYWSTHGVELDGQPGTSYDESLALFGMPLTEPYMYTTRDGETIWVQWFERARFEWRGGNPPETKVLLGRLGAGVLSR